MCHQDVSLFGRKQSNRSLDFDYDPDLSLLCFCYDYTAGE